MIVILYKIENQFYNYFKSHICIHFSIHVDINSSKSIAEKILFSIFIRKIEEINGNNFED